MASTSTVANVDNTASSPMDDTANNNQTGDWGEFLSKSVAALNIKNEPPMMNHIQSAKQPSSPWSSTIITMPPMSSPEEHGEPEEYIFLEEEYSAIRSHKKNMTEYRMPPKLQRCESNAHHAHFSENNEYAVDGHQLSSFLADNESPSTTNVSFFAGNTFSSSLYEPNATEDFPASQSTPKQQAASLASPASTKSIQTPSTVNFSSWSPCLDIDAHASPYSSTLSASSSNACTPNMAHYTTLAPSPVHPSSSSPFLNQQHPMSPSFFQSPTPPSGQEQRTTDSSERNNQFNHGGFVDRHKSTSAAPTRYRSASVISEFSSSPFQSRNTASPTMDRMRPRAASEAAVQQQTQSSLLIGPPSLYQYRDPAKEETEKVEAGKYAKCANTLNMGSETALYYEVEFKRFRKDIYIGAANFRVGDYVKVEADRGHDLGRVVSVSSDLTRLQMDMKAQGVQGIDKRSKEPLKLIQGLATAYEMNLLRRKLIEEYGVLEICRTKVEQRNLPMVVIDAEFQFDHHKLTFYFEADRRIDFRELVRDLFAMYKTRIWMQQVTLDSIQCQSSNLL